MMGNFFISITLISAFLLPLVGFAHPGRTDSSGCHTCRTNCPSWGLNYGEYHCHQAKALPQPEEPIKSHYGDEGTGYTTPAPEYKIPMPVVPKPTTLPTPTVIPKPTVFPQPIPVPKPVVAPKDTFEPLSASMVPATPKQETKRGLWQWILNLFR